MFMFDDSCKWVFSFIVVDYGITLIIVNIQMDMLERRRADRLPVRPAPHERGNNPGTHETDNSGQRADHDSPRLL